MDDDSALETIAALLDSLDTWDGESGLSAHLGTLHDDLRGALQHLSQLPSRSMIADVLVDKTVSAFALPLHQFQQSLCTDGPDGAEPALLCLRGRLEEFLPLITDWCTRLGLPNAASMFPVHIRCRIVQADLFSGEEPPGKTHLMAFLRRHCRDWLRGCGQASGSQSVRTSVGGRASGPTAATVDVEASTVQLFGHLARKSTTPCDPVFSALHRLTLSEVVELKRLWHDLLEESISERVDEALGDEVYGEYKLTALLQWEETTIASFVHMALPSASAASGGADWLTGLSSGHGGFDAFARSEKESWCAEMRQKLLRDYTRRRIAPLWDILAEYPDSIPALVDVRYCLETSHDDALKSELMTSLKRLLATRLHRAGTRTEDILAMLVKAIHSLGVLLSRNEQNTAIHAVVGDTLAHLHKRKDSVAAIVQFITQWSGDSDSGQRDALLSESGLPTTAHCATVGGSVGGSAPAPSVAIASRRGGGGTAAAAGAGEDDTDEVDGGITDSLRSGTRGQPDILRVLLSAIPLRSLVQEYQRVLAQQLLSKGMSSFDTTPEEEVLERLKCTFGEEPLSQCVVMLRDIQMSRRLTQQLRGMTNSPSTSSAEQRQSFSPPLTAPEELSVDVLSLTAWPPLPRAPSSSSPADSAGLTDVLSPHAFTPHPSLEGEMARVAELYKHLLANRRLVWLLPESRVKIEVMQREGVRHSGGGAGAVVAVEYEVSLFVASLVLFLRESSPSIGLHASSREDSSDRAVPLAALAARVNVTVEQVVPHVQLWSPKLFVLFPAAQAVALQTSLVRDDALAFDEAEAATASKEEPIGFAPEQLKLYERLLKTMIKTQGPKTANEVFNSIKIVGGFTGTLSDARKLLQHFVSANVLALNDAKAYTLPPA